MTLKFITIIKESSKYYCWSDEMLEDDYYKTTHYNEFTFDKEGNE